MTTAAEVMPTLREIEAGLRTRLEELNATSAKERAARERARKKVEDTAIRAGDDHSIGDSLDTLLEDLGLHGRPENVNVIVLAEYRQRVPPVSVRNVSLSGGGIPWASYQNLSDVWVHTTARVAITQQLPRDSTTCACVVEISDDDLRSALGTPIPGVEQVGVTIEKCGYSEYPHTTMESEPSACATMRAKREEWITTAHDDPLVQRCEHGHHGATRHRHYIYPNGSVGYTARIEAVTPHGALILPGWYGTGDQVGLPIPTPPTEPVDLSRVQQCDVDSHPNHALHRHVLFAGHADPSYARDLTYTSDGTEEVMPGVFSKDSDIVGGLVPA